MQKVKEKSIGIKTETNRTEKLNWGVSAHSCEWGWEVAKGKGEGQDDSTLNLRQGSIS